MVKVSIFRREKSAVNQIHVLAVILFLFLKSEKKKKEKSERKKNAAH